MKGSLGDVGRALRTLWVTGAGTPDPELGGDLLRAADQARDSGASGLADALISVRDALSKGDATTLFEAQLQAWMRWRTLQRGLAAGSLRARLAEGPDQVSDDDEVGWSGRFHPLGAVVVPPRVHVHGLDDDGVWRTFVERAVAIDGYDSWSRPWISRVFQAETTLGRAVRVTWRVQDHPGVRTARRWVGKPAFRTRPALGSACPKNVDVGRLPVGERLGVGRAEIVAQHTRDGWTVTSDGQRVRVGACLLLNLDKLRVDEGATIRRDAVVLAGQGERVLLQWGEPAAFPTLDPGACTWRAAFVREQATGGWGAVLRLLLGAWLDVEHEEGLAAVDGFPATEGQAFWRQWVGLGAGRAVSAPAPELVAALRGSAAGEPADPQTLLQALWSLEAADALGAEGAVLLQVAGQRGVARDGDVLEAVLQARLARHGVVGERTEEEEEARSQAYGERIEEEARAVLRRLAHDGVVPELEELFWLGDALAEVRGDDRRRGVERLGLPEERVDRALVARLGAWRRGNGPPDAGDVCAWAVAVGAGRTSVFVEK